MFTMREAAAVARELRLEREWTQADLAERARVAQSFVADLEIGKAALESAKLFDVFQAFWLEVALWDRLSGLVRW